MSKPLYSIFLVIATIVIILTFYSIVRKKSEVKNHMNYERIKYLKDSLEMEYYKKQLESYPFDHSEIKDTLKTKEKWQTKW
jgi:hypothetical protein